MSDTSPTEQPASNDTQPVPDWNRLGGAAQSSDLAIILEKIESIKALAQERFDLTKHAAWIGGASVVALFGLGLNVYYLVQKDIESKFEYLDSKIENLNTIQNQHIFELLRDDRLPEQNQKRK